MLFNSYAFIFVFLPLALVGYLALSRFDSRRLSIGWLIVCSVGFYGIWNPLSLAIILPSIAINYILSLRILRCVNTDGDAADRHAHWLLVLGIVFNLCFLGYFKYKNFFLDSSNTVFGSHWPMVETILPLGISFITFQKIAFLVDVRAGAIKEFNGLDFLIFVFFFPQLIAGPIVHYREMMPQFGTVSTRIRADNLAVGLGLFAIGLFKKAVLADGVAPHSTAMFDAALAGEPIDFVAAWIGSAAYALQIYFDFSGYSDMAIGLARMFGIQLPANFNSPFKSSSIIEFWSRWHMTLTRFLTAYVYTPATMSLTRSRIERGLPVLDRKHRSLGAFVVLLAWPTLLTMFLSGFWHGAGLTFIVWGLLHGVLLCINHGWRQWRPAWNKAAYERVMKPLGLVITLTVVVLSMVFFRAKTFDAALHVLHAMAGLDGFALPQAIMARLGGVGQWMVGLGAVASMASGTAFIFSMLWVVALGAAALALPNSLQIMQRFEPALHWKPTEPNRFVAEFKPRWALVLSLMMLAGVMSLNRISEFLYWQF